MDSRNWFLGWASLFFLAALTACGAPAQPPAAGRSASTHVPETVSPEWQVLFRKLRAMRGTKESLAPTDFAAWNARHEAAEKWPLAISEGLTQKWGAEVAERELGGVPVLDVRPRDWTHRDEVVVYLHGGGYTLLSARSTMGIAVLFAHATGRRVISVDYTVAPKAQWRQVLAECAAVVAALQAEGYPMSRVLLFGESAGGGLAAGLALKLRDDGRGIPNALVLWSPWADITQTGDTYYTLRDDDPIVDYESYRDSANAYAAPAEQKHPYVSPVYGDFTKGFPPTLIQIGTKEVFLSNAVRLYQAIDSAGGVAKLDVYEGMVHDFQIRLVDSPESVLALRKVTAFVDAHQP